MEPKEQKLTFEQAESMLKSAESQTESAQTQVTLAENRLSYTRLVSESCWRARVSPSACW